MARFHKFVIHLEYNDEPQTLEELQNDFEEAVKLEDYKAAAKIRKDIDERLKSDNEPKYYYQHQFQNQNHVHEFRLLR